MARTWTPDVVEGTRTTITVKRACDGCGELIGDITDEEIERAIAGLPPLSVAAEHGCGAPSEERWDFHCDECEQVTAHATDCSQF